jgi:phosphosulfolactate synthase
MLDGGLSTNYFKDIVCSHGQLIDFIKLGWGTALVTQHLDEKINFAHSYDIPVFLGGTFFEKALLQHKVAEYRELCQSLRLQYVEISNGSIGFSNREKSTYISDFAKDFTVFSEVGYKDEVRSRELNPKRWIEFILQDLSAGATKVIAEARESGRSGICRADGTLRYGLITEILESEIPSNDLIFEAPTKELQVYFIRKLGANVNLANVACHDVVSAETLRLGFRADTLEAFEEADNAWCAGGGEI